MSGCAAAPPSGDLNPGNLSVSGQRETSNGFSVNGSDVEEDFNNGTAIIPNLDSIQDFKVLTSNFDAEYGNFSGGQVLATTKSGGNKLHGSAFEFLRNTALDSRNYFDPTPRRLRAQSVRRNPRRPHPQRQSVLLPRLPGHPHDPGPGDRQHRRTQPRRTSAAIFPTLASQLTGTVSSAYWANQLSAKLGQTVTAGEPYSQVFPNGVIPQSIWSCRPPRRLHRNTFPKPNVGPNAFSTSSQNETLGDNKAAARFDSTQAWAILSAYYFIDQYNLNNPYPTAQGGANVPGFNALSNGRAQLLSLGLDQSLRRPHRQRGALQLHARLQRHRQAAGRRRHHLWPRRDSPSLRTCSGQSTPRASASFPSTPALKASRMLPSTTSPSASMSPESARPTIPFSGATISPTSSATIPSKWAASFHLDQVNIHSNSINNGSFVFQGTETGSDFADFLLGVASSYEQGDASSFYIRNKYIGVYAQDSWQARPNLVFNYGVRWDVLPPWHEKYNQLQTFVLGQQSQVYPGAPTGIVFPGDPGIPSTLAPTKWTNFSPRLGCHLLAGFGQRPSPRTLRPLRQEQHPRRLRHLLLRIRRSFGGHHERQPALRIRLRQHRRTSAFQ